MTKTSFRVLAPAAALAVLLSACGGGDDEGIFVDERDPSATGQSASVTVTVPDNTALSGAYASTNIFLNNVTKVDPIGEPREQCRFRFSALEQQVAGSSRRMDGDIRYIPGTNALDSTEISIAGARYQMAGTTGATIDRAGNRVVYNGAVLTSREVAGQTLTLTGSIPMRGDRPEGC
ncbi:MAG TPA: hypothetical protein VGE20_12740 [Ramlibacter sp.]